MNTSILDNNLTARTNPESANQRAFHISSFAVGNVLELCCGPSLKVLESAYNAFGITCTGNDVERRWKDYHPEGKWLMGDCFSLDYSPFDAVVFAPPVTLGCTGRRVDSLSIEQVVPSYYEFLEKTKHYEGLKVMVLPARCLVPGPDSNQFYKLLYKIPSQYFVIPLTEGRRNIRKYVDVYFL